MPLWIARDDPRTGATYVLCRRRPEKTDGEWNADDWQDPMFPAEEDVPVQLKPGDGPIKVKLVVDE